jgi:iron complex transport system ATP-binding protein
MHPPVLQLSSATVVKGGTPILHSLDLAIERGQHTAILGPNGAGKTSLINLLTRDDYAQPSANGVPPVRIFGLDRWDVFELRTRLGIVTSDLHQRFVEGNSLGRVTGEDAVVSGFFATRGFLLYSDVTGAMRERARQALDRVGAGFLADRPMHEMSTGEARRVLIARALVTSPEALVLDEPVTGLDLVARHRFLESIDRLARDNVTVVLITHHVEEIVPSIQQVVLLKQGRILIAGEKRDVLTAGHLSNLFDAPVQLEARGGYFLSTL